MSPTTNAPLLMPPPRGSSVPVRTCTVPPARLLKTISIFVVVPATDLVKVPLLVNVPPPTMSRVNECCATKVPELSITAPVDTLILPLDQVAVFEAGISSRRCKNLVLLLLRVIPPLTTVVPVPLIVPPVQVSVPLAVRSPAPVSVPARPTVPLTVSVAPELMVSTAPELIVSPAMVVFEEITGSLLTLGIVAVSPPPGVPPGQLVQLAALENAVPLAPVHWQDAA